MKQYAYGFASAIIVLMAFLFMGFTANTKLNGNGKYQIDTI